MYVPLPLYKTDSEPFIFVLSDKLVQVYAKTFTDNTKMVSEIEIISHSYIVMPIFRILPRQACITNRLVCSFWSMFSSIYLIVPR
jgi:hypothetical protein